MRTKTLLLAAALLAGVSSTMAQVYSVNAVGFVNVTLPAGKFKMIANPLNSSDNTLNGLLKGLPNGTQFYKYGSAGFEVAGFENGSWDINFTLNPGEGGFIKIPAGEDKVVTFVGEVPQSTAGSLDIPLRTGFQIVSSIVPQSLVLSSPSGAPSLNFPAADGDTVYLFRNNSYDVHGYSGGWDQDPGPTPNVGEAFWVRKVAATTWTRTFTVN